MAEFISAEQRQALRNVDVGIGREVWRRPIGIVRTRADLGGQLSTSGPIVKIDLNPSDVDGILKELRESTSPHRDTSAAGIFNFLSGKCPRARLVCKHANSAARATLLES